MSYPKPQETVQFAVAPEAVGRGLDPRHEWGKKIAELVKAGRWREGLESASRPPVDTGKRDRVIDENIGTERKADGTKKRSTNEEERFDKATDFGHVITTYLDKGYDSPDLTTIRIDGKRVNGPEMLRECVLDRLSSAPGFRDVVDQLRRDPSAKLAFTERVLRDPRFADFVRTHFDSTLEIQVHDGLSSQDNILTDLNNQKGMLDEKNREIQKRIDRNNPIVEQYEPDTAKGTPYKPHTNGEDLWTLQKDKPQTTANLAKAEAELVGINARLRQLQEERARAVAGVIGSRGVDKIDDDIRDQTALKTTELGKISDSKRDLTRLEDLIRERDGARADQPGLADEMREVQGQIKTLEQQIKDQTALVADATKVREAEEKQFVRQLEEVFNNAADDWVNADVEEASRLLDEDLEKQKEQAKTETERQTYDFANKRYTIEVGGKYYVDKDNVNEDFDIMMDKGLDELTAQFFRRMDSATYGSLDTAQIFSMLSDQGIDVANIKNTLGSQLLQRRMMTGGVRKDEMRVIMGTTWGQDVIGNAVERNTHLNDAMGELERSGGLKLGWGDRARRLLRNHPKLWYTAGIGAVLLASLASVEAKATSEDWETR